MTDVVMLNGYEGSEQFSPGDEESCFVKDQYPEITDQQLAFVLQSELFREGLQNMVAEHVPDSSYSSGLSYGGKVVGPVTPVGDIHGVDTLNYSKGDKLARGKLAACYRLADINGWSQGLDSYLSARLPADNSFLIAPCGLTYDEVTASSLIKVSQLGDVIDNGSTTLSVDRAAVALHVAAYSGNKDLTCVVHVASPPAVSVSIMKCGLLPLCQEAMTIGEVEYANYSGDGSDINVIQRAFASHRVVFLRNYGVLVSGESIEEAFLTSLHAMTAVSTQMNLVPLGLSNVHVPSNDIRSEAYRQAHELPAGVTTSRQWRYGELEFEALMRQLDNAGYRTGHIYQDQATSYRRGRSSSEADVSAKKLSIANDSKDLASLNLSVHRKGALAAEWIGSPNVYHREDLDQSNANRKVTRWISETAEEQWVSESGKPPRSQSVRSGNANRFAPQGNNPNELRQKVKEIRKEYFDDTITAGPQSTVLEGVTWEEAQKLKEGQNNDGFDIRVSAASRGIIQREHQRDALFYKNFSQINPFERITKDDLEAYKQEVEKKSRRGYGRGGGGYTSAESDSEYLPDNRPMSAPLLDHGTFSQPPQPYSPVKIEHSPVKVQVTQKTSASPQTNDDDVFRDMPRSSTMPLPKQPHSQAQGRGVTPTDQEQAAQSPVTTPKAEVPTTPVTPESGHVPQRTQSARYPPEKRPEIKDEFRRNVKSSKSMRQPDRNVSDTEAFRSAGPASSVDGSEAGTLPKDKKKKRGFRLPSFSKKKEKQ